MKSVRIAAVVLVLTVLLVIGNSIVVRELIDGVIEDVETAGPEEYRDIFENFKRIEKYISLTVDHEDMMNIELGFAELIGMGEVGDEEGAQVTKSRLKYSLEHLKRLAGMNIDSIF